MNDNRYRDALVAYSKTLPPTISDDDREKVLLAYLDELAEADITQVTTQGTLQLEQDSQHVQHDILQLQHAEQSESELQAARSLLG